ncbi:quercetin 2,3-dioxygenase [Paenibacillus kyungheensis]
MTTTSLITHLPDTLAPYLLRRGEGQRYLFGKQLATVIANFQSTGDILSAAIISGPKGESFPLHTHQHTYESIFVLEGKVQFVINGQSHLLLPGDYAHIPPMTEHAYQLLAHRNAFISYSIAGNVTDIYEILGQAHAPYEYPAVSDHTYSTEHLQQAMQQADITFATSETVFPDYELVNNSVIPDAVESYVLESGEGTKLLTGDQLHRLLATQASTDGDYIMVSTEGPKGDAIVSHYHEHHTETFFCVQGQMTMWANGEEVQLLPGDFLHVSAGTVHSYRLDTHYTKFVGVLLSGLFEPFFRLLGDEYEHYIFPDTPGPLRMDRVIANIQSLDLKVVTPPGGHRPE